jgi:thioredoxin-related protein
MNLQAQTKTKKIMSSDGIKFFHGSIEELFSEAKKQNKLVFIDVYTVWCGPCKLLQKKTFPEKKCGDYFNEHFVSYKLDAEDDEIVGGEAFVKTHKISAYPTLLFLDENRKVLAIDGGFQTVDELIATAKDVIAGTGFKVEKQIKAMQEKFEQGESTAKDINKYIDYLKSNKDRMSSIIAMLKAPVTLTSTYKEKVLTNDEYLNTLSKSAMISVSSMDDINSVYWFIIKNKVFLEKKNFKIEDIRTPGKKIDIDDFLVKSDIRFLNHHYVGEVKITDKKREPLAKKHVNAYFKTSGALDEIAMNNSQTIIYYFLKENRSADIVKVLEKMLEFHENKKADYERMNVFASAAIAGEGSINKDIFKIVMKIFDHYEAIGEVESNIYHFRSQVYRHYKMYDKALKERNRSLAWAKEIKDDIKYKWYLGEKKKLEKLMKN